jgi:hypothetical protein
MLPQIAQMNTDKILARKFISENMRHLWLGIKSTI